MADGLQDWILLIMGRYQVEACGAAGGEGFQNAQGAKISGEIQLLEGILLTVLVGQRGISRSNFHAGSGGGGTLVVYTNSSTPLAIVGGGRGGAADAGEPGQEKTSGACTEEIMATVVLSVNMKIQRIPMVGLVVDFSVMAVAFTWPSVIVTFVQNTENRSKAAAKVEEESMLAAVTEDSVVEGRFIRPLEEGVVSLGLALRNARGMVAALSR